MAAPALRLFCDRKSHPARSALLLLKATNIPHEEVKLNLFRSLPLLVKKNLQNNCYRGDHWKVKELPFKKLPVLTHGNLTIAESTSILRYIGQLPGLQIKHHHNHLPYLSSSRWGVLVRGQGSSRENKGWWVPRFLAVIIQSCCFETCAEQADVEGLNIIINTNKQDFF